jgi:hypothetical protein
VVDEDFEGVGGGVFEDFVLPLHQGDGGCEDEVGGEARFGKEEPDGLNCFALNENGECWNENEIKPRVKSK